MIAGYVLLGLIAAIVVTYLVLSRSHRSKYFAIAEYWVYLPGVKLPEEKDLMDRMIRGNPYSKRGISPIGPKEGLVFSDVRLHLALVLRSKNPHIFRPDLFEEHIEPTPALIDALKSAKSMVKIRYASDIPLPEKTHLQFLIHAADAVAELAEGEAIFDVKAERLLDRKDLQSELRASVDVTGSTIHTQVVWKQTAHGAIVESRGLEKIGLENLKTAEMEPDQRVIATTVMTEAIRLIWESGSVPESLEVTTFDDTFKVQFEKVKNALTKVRILRVQAI